MGIKDLFIASLMVLVMLLLGYGIIYIFTYTNDNIMVEDEYLYGDYFCSSFACTSTEGHTTQKSMTIFEKWKYNKWLDSPKP